MRSGLVTILGRRVCAFRMIPGLSLGIAPVWRGASVWNSGRKKERKKGAAILGSPSPKAVCSMSDRRPLGSRPGPRSVPCRRRAGTREPRPKVCIDVHRQRLFVGLRGKHSVASALLAAAHGEFHSWPARLPLPVRYSVIYRASSRTRRFACFALAIRIRHAVGRG